MITKVDHIGVAVRSIDDALSFYRDILGLQLVGRETVASQGVRVAFLQAGETTIELLEPLDEEGPVARFIARRGEGIHHVALGSSDIDGDRARVGDAGARLLSEAPLDGAHDKLISFVHPRDTHGVLLELCQRRDAHATTRAADADAQGDDADA